MPSYTLTPEAYALPLLHAAAHPEADVAGLLLGRGGEVVTALPVLHRYASLSPTLELGIDMARVWGKQKGLEIMGYYEARGNGSARIGEAVLAALRAEGPALGLVLHNGKLRTTDAVYTTSPADASVAWPSESVRAGALELVRKDGVQLQLRDLDDHLDDSRNDWLGNAAVRAAVAKLA
ncbi:hypothetical protein CC85DRAFT_288964 [Cutaneotrichosporon oleaginosum]|uniref:MPN domain-containing protein n=1 Tax=Cutaneotrichosporon oleaginosum TaxID=879819 RepID=A0A0J0XD65_9TREE|nr:uncharacterized protein CC85DRAFT_288964 [Cutaneotrichosporon oleaginosum]KLT38992.1 hypothetical protein CC85DRAFT_288964 [Cutaneotrichosporon oleaginosum]TXT08299.1 hypothetical protein COLE_05223 [Cutaneotrichosporon oleaginosum]